MKSFSLKLVSSYFPIMGAVIHCRLGKDATEAFEDVGHSDEARALLPGFLVGEFEQGPNVNLIPFPLFFLL
jgi:cytochrome b involved in lipid metabolism